MNYFMVKNILTVFSKPITCNLGFFFLLYILLMGPNFWEYSILNHVLITWTLCYLLVLPNLFLPRIPRRIYSAVLLGLASVDFIINMFCSIVLGKVFNDEIVVIIGATNMNEIREFLMFYISSQLMLLFVACFCGLLLLYYLLKKISFKSNIYASIVYFVLFGVGAVLGLVREDIRTRIFFGKLEYLEAYEETPNLGEYVSDPEITFDEKNLPENIVVIIGESLAKSHSSLYGYEKNTNPRLAGISDSLLHVYSEVKSPACNTIACFKSLMSTYRQEDGERVKWYECPTLIEVMKRSGYRTHWLSNQSKFGLWDNIVGRYSDLCDTQYFVGNKFRGLERTDYDEELIGPLMKLVDGEDTKRNFYVCHLMGSHSQFDSRYPSRFSHFRKEEYEHLSSLSLQNREIVSCYDNSVLYNDSVVFELINVFKDKETLLLYFSDHGLDVFKSSNDYCGHGTGNQNSWEIARQIPFIVYTSQMYRERFPVQTKKIKDSRNIECNSGDLIFSLMNLCGIQSQRVEFVGNSFWK